MRPITLALFAATAMASVQPAHAEVQRFHADHVLGTALDIVIGNADSAQAERIVAAARDEIDRLDSVLSGWRGDSELARLNASSGPFAASADLFAVIQQCEAWRKACGGAFSARLGAVERLWRDGEATGRRPSAKIVRATAQKAEQADVRLDAATNTIERSGVVFAVDALAKGYIIDAALAAARRKATPDQGVLIDIGGDIACAGPAPAAGWRIGLARGADADNLAPRQALSIDCGAIATSGGGARDLRIGDQALIHVVNPRTGEPAERRTVSVVARSAAEADALATVLGVAPVPEGLALARLSGAEARIVAADGAEHATEGWSNLLLPVAASCAEAPPPALQPASLVRVQNRAWPSGYRVDIGYEIPRPPQAGRRVKPPFVAIWIADANGKLIRTLFHLGDHPPRYLDSNYVWYNALGAAGRANELMSVTRPSRGPGQYTAVWDGKTDAGGVAPQGRYTINVEISREHGGHSLQSMPVTLGAAPTNAAAAGQGESGPASVRYGPALQGSDT
ncbi:MAG: hypothetical protein BGN86_06925 [Caulobacterales bacterium 68-7]|nr:MAG: hypothetical protein BGN86_06925 [Caulobacterales bacterium 68-7]